MCESIQTKNDFAPLTKGGDGNQIVPHISSCFWSQPVSLSILNKQIRRNVYSDLYSIQHKSTTFGQLCVEVTILPNKRLNSFATLGGIYLSVPSCI